MNPKRGYPDLFIAEPRDGYSGMFLEIKKEGTVLFKKDGKLRKGEHIEEQRDMLRNLYRIGYYADFGIGFDDCKAKIDFYLNLKT